ncbi:hypothetical protein ATB93_06765 [Sphingomonas sp. WG]|nr:hypothetical protein ATB93_06765 [Sphingomonas sp. WG]
MQGKKSLAQEKRIPALVICGVMRVAVDFNHQTFGRAEEVADAWKDHLLSAEFMPELRIGKMPPQVLLELGWITPHFASAGQ